MAAVLLAGCAALLVGTAVPASAATPAVQYVQNARSVAPIGVDPISYPVSATCPAGTDVAGGGYEIGNYPSVRAAASAPDPDTNRWTVVFDVTAGSAVTVHATCVVED